jgi:hypothetical protein
MSSEISDILANPAYHDYLAILKGARNGFVYGVKVRFPHALVMSVLFGRGRFVWNISTDFLSLSLTNSSPLIGIRLSFLLHRWNFHVAFYVPELELGYELEPFMSKAGRTAPSSSSVPQDSTPSTLPNSWLCTKCSCWFKRRPITVSHGVATRLSRGFSVVIWYSGTGTP